LDDIGVPFGALLRVTLIFAWLKFTSDVKIKSCIPRIHKTYPLQGPGKFPHPEIKARFV
jgi:hypothetical protein